MKRNEFKSRGILQNTILILFLIILILTTKTLVELRISIYLDEMPEKIKTKKFNQQKIIFIQFITTAITDT